MRKVSAIQTIHQLLNGKTILRNLIGNTGFAVVEALTQNLIGVPLDMLLGKFTSKRTMTTFQTKKAVEGLFEGWRKCKEDVLEGIDTTGIEMSRLSGKKIDPIRSQYDLKLGTFNDGFYSSLEKLTGLAMKATDRAAFGMTFKESLHNQMKAAKLKNPTQEMILNSMADGLYRTFQDTNMLSKLFSGLKKSLNLHQDFGIGDLILKYPKTPANLFARQWHCQARG